MTVAATQRWRRDWPCPICGGHPYEPRGVGRRCAGYLSSDGRYARCSRPEHAGQLAQGKDGLYAHRLGVTHGVWVAPAPPKVSARPPGKPIPTVPAWDVPPVAQWLAEVRKIQVEEIRHMRAVERTRSGPAVAFEYGGGGACKIRPIDAKEGMFRSPAGYGALPLYGLQWYEVGSRAAIIVEGELDVHVLRGVGIDQVVSVPDGARTRITPDLLAPIRHADVIHIATDNDPEGDGVALRLAAALGPERCVRVRFGNHKDANDYLRAGATTGNFVDAICHVCEPMASARGAA